MKPLVKTSGATGMHLYVPIVRGPTQKQVWTFAKALARLLASRNPKLITAEYRIAKRPRGRVLVDYNQNAWGRTLASVYSVRPTTRPRACRRRSPGTRSREGFDVADFHLRNVPGRIGRVGDLWKPLLAARGRFRLDAVL